MATILEKANQILEEKNLKILPTTLKEGITFFDVEGSVIELQGQTKVVTPTTEVQTIAPDENYNGITEVTIQAVDSTIDENILAENIKEGVTILGVTGTLTNTFSVDILNAKYYDSEEDLPLEGIDEYETGIIVSAYEFKDVDVEANPTFTFNRLYLPKTITLNEILDETTSYYLDFNTFLDIQLGYQPISDWDDYAYWYLRFGSFGGMGGGNYKNYYYESLDGKEFTLVTFDYDDQGKKTNVTPINHDVVQNYNNPMNTGNGLFVLNTANGYQDFDKTILSQIIKQVIIKDQTFYQFNGTEWIKQ